MPRGGENHAQGGEKSLRGGKKFAHDFLKGRVFLFFKCLAFRCGDRILSGEFF